MGYELQVSADEMRKVLLGRIDATVNAVLGPYKHSNVDELNQIRQRQKVRDAESQRIAEAETAAANTAFDIMQRQRSQYREMLVASVEKEVRAAFPDHTLTAIKEV